MKRRSTAILLGGGTLAVWFFGISYAASGFDETPFRRALDAAYPFFVAIAVLTLIGYMLHALRSGAIPSEKRALWAVVLFLGHMFAQPFYFWFYIWPGRSRPSPVPRPNSA